MGNFPTPSHTWMKLTATLTDNTTGSTATIIGQTCTNSGAWVNATGSLTAGHSYTLTLTSHDDNYSSDPTYTLYDDVTITTGAGLGGGRIPNGGGGFRLSYPARAPGLFGALGGRPDVLLGRRRDVELARCSARRPGPERSGPLLFLLTCAHAGALGGLGRRARRGGPLPHRGGVRAQVRDGLALGHPLHQPHRLLPHRRVRGAAHEPQPSLPVAGGLRRRLHHLLHLRVRDGAALPARPAGRPHRLR